MGKKRYLTRYGWVWRKEETGTRYLLVRWQETMTGDNDKAEGDNQEKAVDSVQEKKRKARKYMDQVIGDSDKVLGDSDEKVANSGKRKEKKNKSGYWSGDKGQWQECGGQ